MTRFFTADLHLGHKRIIDLCSRPFADVDEMNETLISNWNETVTPEDEVYVLGDVAMGKLDDSLALISRLNGTKYLVAGNHDRCWYGHGRKGAKQVQRYLDCGFVDVLQGLAAIPWGKRDVLINHFPYASHPGERYHDMRPENHGLWLLHGHIHTLWLQRGRQINVGVDAWYGYPVPEEAIRLLTSCGERDLDCPEWADPAVGGLLDPRWSA